MIKFKEFIDVMDKQDIELKDVFYKFLEMDGFEKQVEHYKRFLDESKSTSVTDFSIITMHSHQIGHRLVDALPELHKSYKTEEWEDKAAMIAFILVAVHDNFIETLKLYKYMLDGSVDNLAPELQKQMCQLWANDKELMSDGFVDILKKANSTLEKVNNG